MSNPLILHLSDEVLAALRREAEATGRTPENLAARVLEQRYGFHEQPAPSGRDADDPFERLFGSISGPIPGDTDNEAIDADLARVYGNDHEAP